MRNPLGISALKILPALAILTASLALAQAQAPEDKLQRSFAVNPGSTLRVENYKGTIHVTGSDTGQVSVTALKRFSGSDSERKEWMENTKVELESSGNRVEVRVRYPDQSWSCWLCWREHEDSIAQVDLEIQVPHRINLDLDGYKPDIRIFSVQGDVRVKSYKAPMTIESTTGKIFIDTYKDDLRLRNVAVHGGLEIKSYKANVEVEARALDGTVRLENTKGSIVLRVPADLGMNVDFSGSRRASFQTDFPLATETSSRYGSDVHGSINHGGTEVILRTEKGSVALKKLTGDL
jgi:hypothetical protein